MLRILVLVALAALFAVAVGCGSPSQDSPESVASPPAETALELLQRSHRIMASVGSFRARTTIEGASMGHELEVSSETDVGANGWTHTLMSVRGTGEAGGEATEIEQVLTGQHAYTKIPGEGSAWVRTGLGALPELGLPSQSRIDPLGFYKGLFPTGVGLPLEAYSVKSAGLRRIFGVKTEHLTVDLDFQQAWAALSQEQQQRLAQSLGFDPNAGEALERLQYESIDIWIDVSGYVRQLKAVISGADDTSLEVGMVLTDFGKQIDIEEPREYVDVSGN